MKKIFFSGMGLLFLLAACTGGGSDNVKKAEDANAARIDSTTKAHGGNAMAFSKSDADFLVKAANGAMMEEDLGRLAESHATNRRVKRLGAMMVKDHAEGMQKIRQIADHRHVVLPDSLSTHQEKEITDLKKKKGDSFDKAYVQMMVDDHKDDINAFQKQAGQGSDSVTRVFASSSLQMLHRHLDSANNLVTVLGINHVSAGPGYPTH